MKKYLVFVLVLALKCGAIHAQETIVKESVATEKTSIGFGLGLDYGGIGGNYMVSPSKNVGLFVGAGYALAGVGYNLGAKVRLRKAGSTAKLTPFLLGMYGYNTALMITNATQYNKFFYGPSFGFGMDLKSSPADKNYWSFSLIVPIRNSDYSNYVDVLKSNYGLEMKNNPSPIAFSVGYRFILK